MDLHVASVEFGIDASHVAEFDDAQGVKSLGARTAHPKVSKPLVEADTAFRGLSLEIGGSWRLVSRANLVQHPIQCDRLLEGSPRQPALAGLAIAAAVDRSGRAPVPGSATP